MSLQLDTDWEDMDCAVALIELTSIARGYVAADAMVKKAPVRLLDLGVVSPGKYLIVILGDVASVEESFLAGLDAGREWVLDRLLLPQPHEDVIRGLELTLEPQKPDAMGLVETFSAISAVRAADVALKAAQVRLLELQYVRHMGGKGFFSLVGELYDVQAALEAAVSSLKVGGMLLRHELIARPHEDFSTALLGRKSHLARSS